MDQIIHSGLEGLVDCSSKVWQGAEIVGLLERAIVNAVRKREEDVILTREACYASVTHLSEVKEGLTREKQSEPGTGK